MYRQEQNQQKGLWAKGGEAGLESAELEGKVQLQGTVDPN